jgi:hypothetical protein
MLIFIKIIVKELLKEEVNQYICNLEKSLYLCLLLMRGHYSHEKNELNLSFLKKNRKI